MAKTDPTLQAADTRECRGCHVHRIDVGASGFCPKCENGGREPEADHVIPFPMPRLVGQTRRASVISFRPRAVR